MPLEPRRAFFPRKGGRDKEGVEPSPTRPSFRCLVSGIKVSGSKWNFLKQRSHVMSYPSLWNIRAMRGRDSGLFSVNRGNSRKIIV